MLRAAMDRVFATSVDTQMIDAMPEYWQYFYHAQRDHKSIEPTDPSIARGGPGVVSAKLLTSVTPGSNDYAQANEIAGIAIYKVILGPDGKPLGVAIYRPIGFGLDENAVEAIRKSTFSAAMKDGKPTSSVFNLTVSFRIYSKLTSGSSTIEANADQH
jgi:TonB family protein